MEPLAILQRARKQNINQIKISIIYIIFLEKTKYRSHNGLGYNVYSYSVITYSNVQSRVTHYRIGYNIPRI